MARSPRTTDLTPKQRNAQAQQAFRARMRQEGLVPVQVYVLPMHKPTLRAVELAARHPVLPDSLIHLTQEHLAAMTIAWTPEHLRLALLDHLDTAKWSPRLDAPQAPLLVSLPEYGDLPVMVAISGNQILVSADLFPVDAVKDRAAANDLALRLGLHSSLSAIGIQRHGDQDVYIAYGQLSALSSYDAIREEIDLLGHNTLEFAHAFKAAGLI